MSPMENETEAKFKIGPEVRASEAGRSQVREQLNAGAVAIAAPAAGKWCPRSATSRGASPRSADVGSAVFRLVQSVPQVIPAGLLSPSSRAGPSLRHDEVRR